MIKISDYHYDLPESLIAQKPVFPRDSSRLFVYHTKTNQIIFDNFSNLAKYLPKNSFCVMNETKVLPSRIKLYKANKGKVRALFLVNEDLSNAKTIRIMVDRKVNVEEKLFFNERDFIEIINQEKQLFTVRFNFTRQRLFDLLFEKGSMPIPLYIKHSPLKEKELRESYQTIFAHTNGSTAAPTASLHFTENVLNKLKIKDVPHFFVTLHVGMGTFAPIDETNIKEKKLHQEWYEISPQIRQKIDKMKIEGRELVAVGTTVVRTLETVTQNNQPVGNTDLFIYPPYKFQMVDHMITNFHLPSSSLMMLVEAFLQHKKARRSLIELYKMAIQEKFRFYSFGDAMLLM